MKAELKTAVDILFCIVVILAASFLGSVIRVIFF